MKVIEAMKKVKANKAKITELQARLKANCSNLSHETPVYGDQAAEKVKEWIQTCEDLARDNVELLVRIQKTNLVTMVPIELDGQSVTKSIAEWVWRRREYANLDKLTWSGLTDRGLKEGMMASSVAGAPPIQVTIKRHFDPARRDNKIARYMEEPHAIDAALEVVNAVTDLVE